MRSADAEAGYGGYGLGGLGLGYGNVLLLKVTRIMLFSPGGYGGLYGGGLYGHGYGKTN